MTLRHAMSCIAVMVASACNSSGSAAQVDPYWLRSWDKARETRPQTMTSTGRIDPPEPEG